MTAAGALTTLHSFECSAQAFASFAGLMQASDGNLYGTAAFRRPRGRGGFSFASSAA